MWNLISYTKYFLCVTAQELILMGSQLRATLVKWIFSHLMDLIAETQKLQVLQSDIGNDFIQAHPKDLH